MWSKYSYRCNLNPRLVAQLLKALTVKNRNSNCNKSNYFSIVYQICFIKLLSKNKRTQKQTRGFFSSVLILLVNIFVMFFSICYHLYNLKNVKNTHGGVLLRLLLLHSYFSRFLDCANGTKSRSVSRIKIMPDLRKIFSKIWYWLNFKRFDNFDNQVYQQKQSI